MRPRSNAARRIPKKPLIGSDNGVNGLLPKGVRACMRGGEGRREVGKEGRREGGREGRREGGRKRGRGERGSDEKRKRDRSSTGVGMHVAARTCLASHGVGVGALDHSMIR